MPQPLSIGTASINPSRAIRLAISAPEQLNAEYLFMLEYGSLFRGLSKSKRFLVEFTQGEAITCPCKQHDPDNRSLLPPTPPTYSPNEQPTPVPYARPADQ